MPARVLAPRSWAEDMAEDTAEDMAVCAKGERSVRDSSVAAAPAPS